MQNNINNKKIDELLREKDIKIVAWMYKSIFYIQLKLFLIISWVENIIFWLRKIVLIWLIILLSILKFDEFDINK